MRRHLVVFLTIALAACGKQDEAEKLQKSADSWRATLLFVADAGLRNEVRSGFARKTAEAAVEELSGGAAKSGLPRSITVRVERLIGIAAKLQTAIESGDRVGIANARRELADAR
ncbi:MAG: hypothetical protein QOE82_1045 [Thermoanaerobaculia bacterium]|jgi:hypothetical protein|nr:hypothetical protein [Thermoanaerobaculia bacterium]